MRHSPTPAIGAAGWMPEARGQVEALDGSLEVLQSDLNVPTEVGRGSKASSMPKAGLDVPLNGPRQEKWWYEVSRILLR